MESEMHVGESAELYVLGLLDDAERAEIDAHVAGCTECLRRVGEAEETLLALERGTQAQPIPPRAGAVLPFSREGAQRRSFSWWMVPAIAAAFVVGMLLPRPAPQQSPATLAMIHSHFSHAQFSGGGPAAKVLYARDRSWYYVIVAGSHRYDVYGIAGAQSTMLGTTAAKGATSELFVREHLGFDRLELREGDKTLETAAMR